MPCTPTCPSLETSAGAYGELHQFPNAGIELALPDDRAVRPTIVSGPSAAVVEAGNWRAIYAPSGGLAQHSVDGPRSGPATDLPTFSVDAPRTAPDAVAKPVAVPVADSGFDWSDAAVGIAIAFGAIALLGAAFLMGGRRRGTLQGA
jgi:hypothetical protein